MKNNQSPSLRSMYELMAIGSSLIFLFPINLTGLSIITIIVMAVECYTWYSPQYKAKRHLKKMEQARLQGWVKNRSLINSRYFYAYSSILDLTSQEIEIMRAMLAHYRKTLDIIKTHTDNDKIIEILYKSGMDQGFCRYLFLFQQKHPDHFMSFTSITYDTLEKKITHSIHRKNDNNPLFTSISYCANRFLFDIPICHILTSSPVKIYKCLQVRIEYLEYQIYCTEKNKLKK